MLARRVRPEKKGSRRSPESRRLKRVSSPQLEHTLLVHSASRVKPLSTGRQSRARSDASELRQQRRDLGQRHNNNQKTFSIATLWITSTRHSCKATGRTWEPRCYQRSHISNSVADETKNRPCHDHTELFKRERNSLQAVLDSIVPIRGVDGHGGT